MLLLAIKLIFHDEALSACCRSRSCGENALKEAEWGTPMWSEQLSEKLLLLPAVIGILSTAKSQLVAWMSVNAIDCCNIACRWCFLVWPGPFAPQPTKPRAHQEQRFFKDGDEYTSGTFSGMVTCSASHSCLLEYQARGWWARPQLKIAAHCTCCLSFVHMSPRKREGSGICKRRGPAFVGGHSTRWMELVSHPHDTTMDEFCRSWRNKWYSCLGKSNSSKVSAFWSEKLQFRTHHQRRWSRLGAYTPTYHLTWQMVHTATAC